MYIPKAYDEADWEQARYLITTYPLATIITFSETEGLIANHIPFVLQECPKTKKRFLKAHLARRNSQLDSLRDTDSVLVIFQSHDSYITPSYYPEKPETHKFVPTWVFASTHIKGKPTVTNDYDFVREQLVSLTDQEEAKRDPSEKRWKVTDAPERYLDLKQKAITGLSIEIESFQCKYKLEQDANSRNNKGVIEGLAKDGYTEVSDMAAEARCRYDARA